MPPFHPFHQFTADNTLGAALIGFAVSCIVFGVILTQAWTYFGRYGSDGVVNKMLVVLIVLLETADQVFITHFVYFYTVTSAGNPRALVVGTTTWSIILQQAFGSIVGAIVKCVFASRVYRFSDRNIFITYFIILLSLGQLGVALTFTVEAFGLSTIPQVFASNLKLLATISLGLSTFTDVVTAAALCFYIRRLRTGYKDADSLVRSLVTDAVNTGVVTSAVSIATLLLYNFLPKNFIFAATYFLLSKLYAVSLLATLNTRRSIRGRGTDDEHNTTSERQMTTREEQEETNMFEFGTRMPTLHDGEISYTYDHKPGFPPPPVPAPYGSYPPPIHAM
ncbi:hypothetical protein B0H11DRAFT_2179339 [Mycena galericulata]|nr:hypothetical protein B0H11DRAFT_2179339 [Mycena galericulata]